MRGQDFLAETEELTLSACRREWRLSRTADLETLWDAMTEDDLDEDERLPYWAEVWPSSMVLAEHLLAEQEALAGARSLDLGCGLGFTACVAASLGARVTAVDYQWPAVYFSRRNMGLNRVEYLPVQMDWRRPAFKPNSFSYMIGGDILYEKRFVDPLAGLFRHVLRPEGRIWLAEPRRYISEHCWVRLAGHGFVVREIRRQTVPWKGTSVEIILREVRKGRKLKAQS
ncbi:MAG: class I SAM-dependent methyltransferase [Desulfovibrionales bacterium]